MLDLYIYLGVYILVLFAISYIVSRRQDKEGFLIAGRKRKGWQILASKFAAGIGVGYFISYTGFAYEYGYGVFTMLAGLFFGYLIFGYWASPKIHAHSKEHKFYTIGDFVYNKTKSKFSMYLADIFSSAILFSWLLTGVIGGAKIINDFGLISYNFAVLLTALVILGYILIAGYNAVIVTDIVQSAVIVILLVVVTFGIVGSQNLPQLLTFEGGGIDIGVAVAFFLFGILSVFSYSDRYQLSYAAESKRGLKHGLGLAAVPIFFAGALLLLVGSFMAIKVPGLDSSLIFTEALKNFLPAALLPFAIVLFFAGIMSSADTNVYAISSHYAMHKKGNPVKVIRRSMIGLTVLMILLSILFPDVVDVSIFAGGISLTLSLAMLYLLFGGENRGRFRGSAIGGLIGLIVGIIYFGVEPTIALPVLIGGALGLLCKTKD